MVNFNQNKDSKPQEIKQEDLTKGGEKPKEEAGKHIFPQNSEKQKILELTETLQRLQAEFENFQKRSTKQNDEFKQYANAELISQILPVLDTLEQGSLHNKELIFVYEQLYSVLKKKGLEKISIGPGTNYNHETMDCLMQEAGEKTNDGKIAHVLISGYLLNEKILRAAKVSVYSMHTENCECEKHECEKCDNANDKKCECEHNPENNCECGEKCESDDGCGGESDSECDNESDNESVSECDCRENCGSENDKSQSA